MDRRKFIKSTMASFVFLTFSGCATEQLFKPVEYTEKVNSLMASADKKTLVILTEKFHYIFDSQENLLAIIGSALHSKINGEIGHFKIDSNNTATGGVKLFIVDKLTDSELEEAKKFGFTKTGYKDSLVLEVKLVGRRYDANGVYPKAPVNTLNKEYVIYVTAEQSRLEKTLKAPLTPITLAIDGTLVIAAIPLFLVAVTLMVTFFGLACHGKKNCLN